MAFIAPCPAIASSSAVATASAVSICSVSRKQRATVVAKETTFFGGRSFQAASAPVFQAAPAFRFGPVSQFSEVYVEVAKPLGVTFEEGPDGRVYVVDVAEGSNGARAGIMKGDRVKATSAVFGDEMWSAENAGFDQVLSAIKIRAYDVRLLLERRSAM
eukprot:tig00021348_g20513.t1